MKVVILCLSVLYLGHAGAQRPDLFWVGGFEEYPNVPGYANYSIRFGNFGAISIDTLDWGIPFESTTAAISDEAGHLVLATNGCVIIDGAGQTIAGGASINPGPLHDQVCNITGYTAPKGAMFLPMPGHPDTYYLLHEAAQYDPHNGLIYGPLYYSKIVVQNGTATAVETNKALFLGELEPFSVVRHGNGRDWWVIVPQFKTNLYHTFLLSPQGIQYTHTFVFQPVMKGRHIGSTAFSLDGSRFARFNPSRGAVVMNFDRCSGTLSNPVFIPVSFPLISGGGVAFSPGGSTLLITSQSALYQADLSTQPASFDTVFQLFDNYKWGTTMHHLQYDADHHLYVSSQSRTRYFNEITFKSPDVVDTNIFKSIPLPVFTARSLPNNPNFRLYDLPGSICDTLGIDGPIVATDAPNDNTQSDVVVTPNPASDVFKVILKGYSVQKVQIFDLAGNMVHEAFQTEVHVGELPSGLYLIQMVTEDGKMVRKPLVIAH